MCRRATSTCAACNHARTSDGVVESCFARHCGLDASRPGAWSFTGDPRTPAVGTSLDASTRVPSTCTGSDRDRRESARERAIHEHSTVAHGRWTMQCASDGEPPRTAANLSLERRPAIHQCALLLTASCGVRRGRWHCNEDALESSVGRVSDKPRAQIRLHRYRVITPHACLVCMCV